MDKAEYLLACIKKKSWSMSKTALVPNPKIFKEENTMWLKEGVEITENKNSLRAYKYSD